MKNGLFTRHYLKKNRHGVGLWIKKLALIFGICANVISCSQAEETMKVNYTINFNTNAAFCLAKVNDILVMDSGDSAGGNYSAGQTISSILENGKNTLTVSMHNALWGESEKKPTPDMWCSVLLKKVNQFGEEQTVTGIKLIVDKDGNIIVDKDFYPSPVNTFGKTERHYEDDTKEATKDFYAEDLPDWEWIKATPVTKADIPKVKVFYEELQQAFVQQDLKKIRSMTKVAWEIMGKERGASPDFMWNSMDFKGFFEKGYKAVPISWDKYEFYTYKNNRIFRFEYDYDRVSPIELEKGDDVFFYNPYLSIVDGKVMVVH
ncbi:MULTISPECIES: hypothetical protein [Photorhabdus]|nr:hypothetical protein [Photorhabdus asymbiotica]